MLPPDNKPPLNLRWLMLMAWRDSRRNRSRLLLFGSSVVMGIAALVAIYSLGDNLQRNVDLQAAALIGADIEIDGNTPASPAVQRLMDSVSRQQSRELRFASMIYFPLQGGTRLVQVRALGGTFPYYGKLETAPAGKGAVFRKRRAALVDKTLMLQYGAKVGDSIRVGELSFVIEASLLKAPGQTGISSSVAPVVYIPLQYLDATGLLAKGSRIRYNYFLQLKQPASASAFTERIEPLLDREGLDYDTIDTQKRDTGRSFEDLSRFLELVAFIALLLGCIGVASAIHIYVREKISMIAILRCLGATSQQAFVVFVLQIMGITLLCSIAGAALGTVIQQLLPLLLQDLIPFEISTAISWAAIGQGILTGMTISLLFALLPLVSIRKISPLNTLRLSFNGSKPYRDPWRWVNYLMIAAFLFLVVNMRLHDWQRSAVFLINMLVALLVLAGVSALMMWFVRRFFPSSWSYLWRQGLSNLYRPNNQTLLLIISIGFGTAFISTLFFIQSILINRITLSASGDQPNIVLFDIQTNQRQDVEALARSQRLPIRPMVPIVSMRLDEVNGSTVSEAQEDSVSSTSLRLFTREYRVTYRDTLTPYEKVTDGKWRGTVAGADGTIYVSMEKAFAVRNGLKLGDTLVFNVQGALVSTVLGSFRQVDWNRIQTNFLVVFPSGVLESAPQFWVFLSRVPSAEASALFQQAVVSSFPNVSIIDLGLILRTLDDILEKIGFVIRFIAAFSIITALVVLIASVLISKYQRMRENVLLRTLGAHGRQILSITALEYFFLGALSAVTGILLSLAGSWALARFVFVTEFTPTLLPIVVLFTAVCALTIGIGLFNSRGILHRPPLVVLRQEA